MRPLAFCALFSACCCSASQFCTQNPLTRTNLCIAMEHTQNTSTGERDLLLSVFAQLGKDGSGWAAVGVGNLMSNALMFTIYPGGKKDETVVSVRSTSGHNAPTPILDGPVVSIVKTSVNESYFHFAELICYSCSNWTSLDVESSSQSWIWATNYEQKVEVSMNAPIHRHVDYDRFDVNMKSAALSDADVTAVPAIQDAVDPGKRAVFMDLMFIHGLFMTGAFAIVFPLGTLAILLGANWSFMGHWVLQITGVVLAVVGITIGLSHFFGNSAHEIAGLFIAACLCLQVVLGYCHHNQYMKNGKNTAISIYHQWLGRGILVAGWMNVGLGLRLARASEALHVTWLIISVLDIGAIVAVYFFRYLRRGESLFEYRKVEQQSGDDL